MKVGFNTNVPYKGKIYHVQTEDCGLKNPIVLTLLYYDGAILASKKTSYTEFLENPDRDARIKELMKQQHKVMMKELIAGKHTLAGSSKGGPIFAPLKKETAPARESALQSEQKRPEKEKTKAEKPEPIKISCEEKPVQQEKDKAGAGQNSKGIEDSLDDVLLDFIMKKHKQE